MIQSHLALRLSNRPPEERMEQAAYYLRSGLYRDGWALYEARREIADHPEHTLPVPVPAWYPDLPLAGRRLLLWHEQGLGDMIQMLRFVPLLARRGARIVLAVQPPLKRLASSLPGVTEVVAAGDAFAEVDYHCPLMSLPYLLGIRLPTVPATVPYLRIPEDRVAAWHDRLGPAPRRRIGIVCSGEASNTLDSWRSIPAAAFAPLFARRDLEFHVLQSEIRPADRDYLAGLPNVRMHEAALTDLCETGALALRMDRVISVCTAVAHLSGALALPTWLLVATRAHWLWLTQRTDSPWYPTLRLFRQQEEGQWEPVIGEVGRQL